MELLNFACEIPALQKLSDHFHVVTWWLHTIRVYIINLVIVYFYSDEGGG